MWRKIDPNTASRAAVEVAARNKVIGGDSGSHLGPPALIRVLQDKGRGLPRVDRRTESVDKRIRRSSNRVRG